MIKYFRPLIGSDLPFREKLENKNRTFTLQLEIVVAFFPLISMLFLFWFYSALHRVPWNQLQGLAMLKKMQWCSFKTWIWMNNTIRGNATTGVCVILLSVSTMAYETFMFWDTVPSATSLSLLPFFLWEVNPDSENRKKGLPYDSKTRPLILDSYTHTRPCPCFLQLVQRTPLNPGPQGSGGEQAGADPSLYVFYSFQRLRK